MSFFFLKQKHSLSFVLDIRDVFVTIAAVKFIDNNKPEIVISKRFYFKYKNPLDHNGYLNSMLSTVDSGIINLRKDLIKIGNRDEIDSHYFFIGSPWSFSQTRIVKIIKDKPFEITNAVLRQIITGEESAVSKYLGKNTQDINWNLLEEKIIQSKIDGYDTNEIYGKKASSLSTELFISFIPKEINSKIKTFLNVKESNSCILSSYSFLRDLYSDKNNFIYIDVGKLITDVYVVQNDNIFGIASFPFGEEDIVRESLSKTNLTREVFLSHINIGHDKKFEAEFHNNGGDLLQHGFSLWQNRLTKTLSQICNKINIPNNIFIIPNTVISKILLSDFLEKQKNNRFEIFGKHINIFSISENIINNLISNGSFFPNEPYLKMDLVFLSKIKKH